MKPKLLLIIFALLGVGGAWAQPTTNPTNPTDVTARVIAVFSDYYNKELTESNNGWGGGPDSKYTSFNVPVIQDGHKVVHVNGTAINGRASGSLNAEYSNLHVVVYPKTATSLKVWDDNKYSSATIYTPLTPGEWNYVVVENVSFSTNYIGIELFNGDTPETEFWMDHFYFAKPPVIDTTAPVLNTATLKSVNSTSATLTLQGTDETSPNVTFKIVDTATSAVYQTTASSGAETDFVIAPLSPSTTYEFSVKAVDENGNESAAQTVNATTTTFPALPAVTTSYDELHVLWNGAEGGSKGLAFYDWGGGTGSAQTVGGNNLYLISNFKWFGSQFGIVDVHTMDYLHFDVLPTSDMSLAIVPINRNSEDTANEPEKGLGYNLNGGEWNAINVPIATMMEQGISMERLYQIKFVGSISNKTANGQNDGMSNGDGTQNFYIGNIYAYKEASDDNVKPMMVSATLTSKTHNSATLTLNATDNSSRVKYHIVDTANGIDKTTGLANQGEDFEYTVVGLTAETTYNFTVTAEDAAGNVSGNDVEMAAFTTNEEPVGQELTQGGHTILLQPYHYVGTNDYELIITSDEVMSGLGGSYWNTSAGGKDLRDNITISGDGKTITITVTSTSAPQLYTPLYVLIPGEVNFGSLTLNWIEKNPANVSIAISAAGWATYCSEFALDFTDVTGLTAYTASKEGSVVKFNKVTGKVPANTGLLVSGTTSDVPVTTGASAVENILKGVTAETVKAAGSVFVLKQGANGLGFYKNTSAFTLRANSAYLDASDVATARVFIALEDEAMGIENLTPTLSKGEGVVLDLSGRRVAKPAKGLYIVNGKKVVMK